MVVGFAGRAVAPAFAGVIVAAGLFAAQARAEEPFHYDETNVRPAVYFAALSNLANAVMFPGLGEALIISPYERDEWLRHAGYVTRPAMPDMAAVGPLYAGAEPRFAGAPDFTVPRTLVWEQSSVDRTLDPSAQAWAMAKITSPEFHLQFHDLPDNKLAGLMMIPQARAQAQTLKKRLLNPAGLFAPLRTDGTFGEPSPRDQIAVLWAASNIILAGTSGRDDYWHAAYRDLTDPDSYRDLLRKAFAAVRKLPPQTPADRGLAIEALGRFALATGDDEEQANALRFAREHADALKQGEATEIEDIAFAIYGLTEAGRLLEWLKLAPHAHERCEGLPSRRSDNGAHNRHERKCHGGSDAANDSRLTISQTPRVVVPCHRDEGGADCCPAVCDRDRCEGPDGFAGDCACPPAGSRNTRDDRQYEERRDGGDCRK